MRKDKQTLDEQLMLFMEQLEALEEKRRKLNSLIEEGWFSIAKARYSMGNKQVSALQYASEMDPLVRVETRTLENESAVFKCYRIETQEDQTRSVEDIGPKETGLRRRINAKHKAIEEDSESHPEPRAHMDRDPLKWFGILVPQNLKQAQTAFQEVIRLSAEMASLQSEILSTRKRMVQIKEELVEMKKTPSEIMT